MSADLLGIIDIGKTHTRFFTADPDSGAVLSEAHRYSRGINTSVMAELDVRSINEPNQALQTLERRLNCRRIGSTILRIGTSAAG